MQYYQLEASKNNWTARQLERQINSQLYERLLMSTDKQAVLAAAREEKDVYLPKEIIKDPMILEFLGLKKESSYYEVDIEKRSAQPSAGFPARTWQWVLIRWPSKEASSGRR